MWLSRSHGSPFFGCAILTIVGTLLGTANAAEDARPVRSLLETRREHVVLQHWDISCAAAALATVLRYQHGVPVSERSVALGLIGRTEYLANPELVRLRRGFSLLDMKQYADGLGYQGIGLGQMTFDDLLHQAPAIVPVRLRGYPHFVVFRGATENRVLVADPAFGNVTVTRAKFIASWIRYAAFGRVGFVVRKGDAAAPPGALAPEAYDFVSLR